MATTNCPTCGCPCEIGGERLTHYYIPAPGLRKAVDYTISVLSGSYDDKDLARILRKLKAALAATDQDKGKK